MLNSIGNTALVRCREVVRFSEGPLSEARLYFTPLRMRARGVMSEYLSVDEVHEVSELAYNLGQ